MKQIDLCGQCAAKMADGYKLVQLPRPANNKIFCGLCGRKRYGATYQYEKRKTLYDRLMEE